MLPQGGRHGIVGIGCIPRSSSGLCIQISISLGADDTNQRSHSKYSWCARLSSRGIQFECTCRYYARFGMLNSSSKLAIQSENTILWWLLAPNLFSSSSLAKCCGATTKPTQHYHWNTAYTHLMLTMATLFSEAATVQSRIREGKKGHASGFYHFPICWFNKFIGKNFVKEIWIFIENYHVFVGFPLLPNGASVCVCGCVQFRNRIKWIRHNNDFGTDQRWDWNWHMALYGIFSC